jgi:hypothetical protein
MPGAVKRGGEFLVNTSTNYLQVDPTITALAAGRFAVAWADFSVGPASLVAYDVRAQIFNADGSPSGGEFVVNTANADYQKDPAIATLTDGRFVVAWEDNSHSADDTTTAVRGRIVNADGSFSSAEFLVNTTTSSTQFEPAVTALAGGRFVAVWADFSQSAGDTSDFAVRTQLFNANGSKFGFEFVVNTRTANGQYAPTIATLTDGRFVVAWQDNSLSMGDTTGAAVRAQIFNANGGRFGVEFVANTTTAGSQIDPTIAALADGRFVLAWADDSHTGGDTSGMYAVRAQVFNADGSKSGGEFLVNTTTGNDQSEPAITGLPDGRFVVAWSDSSHTGDDASFNAVRAQVFNIDGTRSGAEFLANTTTPLNQERPAIEALADGRFVVAWNDGSMTGDDTSSSAVRAQIFDPRETMRVSNFDGDGQSDILLQHANGATYLWEMNGLPVRADAAGPTVDPSWHVREKGDLDGDGKSDVVLQHEAGATYLWEMDGFAVKAHAAGPVVDSHWHVVGAGDLDSDGKSDIVLQNEAGATFLWEMNGLSVKAYAAGPVVAAQWHVVGTGDFDGDGRSDIVLQHEAGATFLWEMNGLSVKAYAAGPTVDPQWHIVGTGDFDGDGKSDIVLQHESGATYFWLMNGLSVKAHGGGPTVGSLWHVRDTGDYDGDGKSDIVLQHDNGQTYFWEMDGLAVKAHGSGPTVDPMWHIV